METTKAHKVHTRIMEKKMETTIVYLGYYWDNGKPNGNYYSMGLGFRVGAILG